MKNRLLLVVVLFITTFVFGQVKISATVYDGLTKAPIEGASVYFDGTSLGAITNAEGVFELLAPSQVSIPLVVRFIGYETQLFENVTQGLIKNIYLKPAALNLEAVVLKPDTWSRARKYRIFKKVFLGSDVAARRTKIKNPEVLRFYYDDEEATLNAYASAPLVLENNYLGYLIRYSLIQFEANFIKHTVTEQWPEVGRSYYSGTTYFNALGLQTKAKYRKHRQKAYLGSILHFMRALSRKELKQEGYFVLYKSKVQDPYAMFSIAPPIKTKNGTSMVKIEMQTTKLTLFRDKKTSGLSVPKKEFYIDAFGNFAPGRNVAFSGYMGGNRVGNLLPLDYGMYDF